MIIIVTSEESRGRAGAFVPAADPNARIRVKDASV